MMPAEWSPHAMTLMCWPANRQLWGSDYEQALDAYEALLRVIQTFEPVRLVIPPADYDSVRRRFGQNAPPSDLIKIEIDDAWVRDSGPIYVRSSGGRETIVRWRFNGWGRKYRHDNDSRLPKALAELDQIELVEAPLVLEGGAIGVDGQGTLITTESVILNANRNPGITKAQAEAHLQQYFGVTKVIWLPAGLVGDETDGHVDNVAAFVAPGTIAVLTSKDTSDENYAILNENLSILHSAVDARGRRLNIVELEQPEPIWRKGKRLTASYVNFYFVNGGLIFPIFNQARDERALEKIRAAVVGRKIAPVYSPTLIIGGGGIHCLTQQRPV